MKKIYSFLVLVCFSVHIVAATFTFSSDASLQQTVDGITLSIAQGGGSSAPKYYTNGMRLYANNTITFSGTNITNVTITFAKQGTKAYAGLIASTGNLVSGGESTSADDDKMDVWTGSAPTVTFTLGATGQRLIKQIVVNGEATTPDNDQPSTPTDTIETPQLDPSYTYAEPTTIVAPNKTIQGAAYDFITNNIAVSSSKGAITQANGTNVLTSYFSAHAGYELTFTATKPIKGIRINGFVKTGFTATVDNGIVTFVSPAEDTEANPVVVVTDINNTSVTLSCVKQLRCYSVEFYFESNPEGLGSTPTTGEEVNFVGYAADYEYYENYSSAGAYNYAIYLYGQTDNDPSVMLDIYTAEKDKFEGTYSTTDGTLGEYCFYDISEEEYYTLVQGSIQITKNANNYTITGAMVGENGVTYNISYTGELIEYDVFSAEPVPAQEFKLACNWIEVEDYTAEYGDVYFYMGNDDYQITLDVFIDAIDDNTILPVGVYPINSSYAKGTILASAGMSAYGALPSSMYAVAYDQATGEPYATDVWYIISGSLQVSQSTKGVRYELNATTSKGSTIQAVYDESMQGIGQVTTLDKNAPMYDVLGRRVGEGYKGIVIQNGQKYFLR